MRILVTGSSGHLGDALVRTLSGQGHEVVGIDLLASPSTTVVGSITDDDLVARVLHGADAVLHTATLHKPHVATHTRQDFVDTNITGTRVLLEAAVAAGVGAFVFTSTTSVFGRALTPAPGDPAVWVTEDLRPIPKNIYGATKTAAEDLCTLVHRDEGLPCLVLRTSRFFPEADDNRSVRDAFDDTNAKVNELAYRRVDLADVVDAHLLAMARAPDLGHGTYIVSATTPFLPEDCAALRSHPGEVLARRVPAVAAVYADQGWRMFADVGRVYVNERARRDLGWTPRVDISWALGEIGAGRPPSSDLARAVGIKGYHAESFDDGPFPVRP